MSWRQNFRVSEAPTLSSQSRLRWPCVTCLQAGVQVPRWNEDDRPVDCCLYPRPHGRVGNLGIGHRAVHRHSSGMVVSRRPVPGISHVHGGAVPLVAQAGGTAPSPYENEYRRVQPWFVAGAVGFFLCLNGAVATSAGLLVLRFYPWRVSGSHGRRTNNKSARVAVPLGCVR